MSICWQQRNRPPLGGSGHIPAAHEDGADGAHRDDGAVHGAGVVAGPAGEAGPGAVSLGPIVSTLRLGSN